MTNIEWEKEFRLKLREEWIEGKKYCEGKYDKKMIEFIRETIAKAQTDAKRDFAAKLWEELEQSGTWIGAGKTKEYVIPWEKVDHILTNQK